MWIKAWASLLIILLPWNVLMQEVLVKELYLSSPRIHFTSIEADGFLYLAGGLKNGNTVSSTIDVFDIASQTWNKTLTLPSPRAIVTPVHIPPHIYFVGGWSRFGSLNTFYNFDLPSRVFNPAPPPRVQNPTQMSIHGSTLLVLGSNSAEFLNITDSSGGWTNNEELDNVAQRVAGGIFFNHENFIFVIGGVNVSSRQPVSDAWIFDIDSSLLTHYPNVITPFNYLDHEETPFSYSVANNIAAAWISSQCFLFNITSAEWFNFNIINVTNIITVPGYTFMFTEGGIYTVDWTNPTANPSFAGSIGTLAHSISFEDRAAYFVNNEQTGATQAFSFDNGVWIPLATSLAIEDVFLELVWPSQGVIFATRDGFYLFKNDGQLTFVALQFIKSIIVAHPDADKIYVVHQNLKFMVTSYNASLISETIVAPIIPQIAFEGILFNFQSQEAHSLVTNTSVDAYNGDFTKVTKWVIQGEYFFALGQEPGTTQGSDQVDVYNYKTDTWLNSTSNSGLIDTTGYKQAFNMNGNLWILTSNGRLRYDVAAGTWDEEISGSRPGTRADLISPMAIEVNGTVYTLALNGVNLIRFENGSSSTSAIDQESFPVHFTRSTKFNQILISTQTTTIFNWNLADQQFDIFLLPITDPEVILASSGNFLLVSGRNLPSLEYFDLSSKGWNKVPGLDNYIRPATMKTVTVNGTELILIAGGYDKELGFYTDVVRLLDINSLASLPAPPSNEEPTTSVTEPAGGEDQDNTTLIVAIVVPVGAALIAGALLALFLLRKRQKKKKNKGNRMSMIGLDSSYGQWYIPFSDLTFGEQLGQGGSGQVFKGTWKNTSVALKLSMTQANKSVLGELSLMMALRPHPNVVQLLGFSVHPETDSIVLVLEYCNQGALDSTLFDSSHDITMTQKVEWLIGISKGLAHLHANNIVHRDVAARNVLLHQNDTKLTDFGMSREVAENQRGTTKSELGPIRWMAPESLKNKEYSVKSGKLK
jgi:hypothetical protein